MSTRFETCLTGFVWRPENDGQPPHTDPGDTGGLTSWGMTYSTFSEWRSIKKLPYINIPDFNKLNRVAFYDCYKDLFWNKVCGDLLPIGLDLLVFDFAVLSGGKHAVEELQKCLGGIGVDGDAGTETQTAIKDRASRVSFDVYHSAQMAYFRNCSTWNLFHNGWTRRSNDALSQAKLDAKTVVK